MEQETDNTTEQQPTEADITPEVEVEVDSPPASRGVKIGRSDAMAIVKHEGVYAIERTKIDDIASLGVAVQEGGVIKAADGYTFWTADKLSGSIAHLSDAIESGKMEDPIKAAYCLGYLAKILFSGAATLKTRPNLLGIPGGGNGKQASFPAHGKVAFTQNNYYNKEPNKEGEESK